LGVKPWGERLRPLEQRSGSQIGFCSIHAFKGLEANAVIVTDIDTIGDEASEALFYVAVTRALHRLVILLHERVKKQVVEMLLQAPDA
jgi:superfamily I DNA/RNA helicase